MGDVKYAVGAVACMLLAERIETPEQRYLGAGGDRSPERGDRHRRLAQSRLGTKGCLQGRTGEAVNPLKRRCVCVFLQDKLEGV